MPLRRTTSRRILALQPGLIAAAMLLAWALGACRMLPASPAAPTPFDGQRAVDIVRAQLAFGPRVTGSPANDQAAEWIVSELRAQGWQADLQPSDYHGTPVRNIWARRGSGPAILLGAHWDSRRRADRDPQRPEAPVPGANDGASGAAVLLELARALDLDWSTRQVWLVFFDAEDNGGLDGWEWIVGSTLFARSLAEAEARGELDLARDVQAAVIVDMVGDFDQRFPLERNSDPALQQVLWAQAAALGYGAQFVSEPGQAILDDHLPFCSLGLPAVDIIDLDYPYWHTTADTLDKVSAESLERVGRTLEAWLEGGAPLAPSAGP
ncbi:MAG: M28 family peptidase [Chloroflexi bacterium]|nr:M28 family peptidase [Chloroflexota bacterium]